MPVKLGGVGVRAAGERRSRGGKRRKESIEQQDVETNEEKAKGSSKIWRTHDNNE